jgi:general nucleoside transport system permease protein
MSTTTEPLGDEAAPPVERAVAEERRLRNIGIALLVTGLVAAFLWVKTASGDAAFKLNDELAPQDWFLLKLPGKATVLICALVLIATAAGLLFLVAFLCWAAAGRGEIAAGIPRSFAVEQQFSGTLKLATPLILGALSGVICERSGVINIAIEGQFLVAAFAAAVGGTLYDSAIVGVLFGIGAGVVWAWLLGVFAIRYLVNQVVLGVVLVLLATGLTGFLLDQIPATSVADLNSPPILEPVEIPGLSHLPLVGHALFQQSILVYLMYASVFLVTWVLFETKWGLRVRAVGEHPRAADTVGIKVKRTRYQAVLLGGVFAGMGGAFFTVGSTGAFDKGQTAGNGFIALAALIMGRWHPIGATLGALFFGFMLELSQNLSVLATPIPGQLLSMVPYAATIVAADGEPYVKG